MGDVNFAVSALERKWQGFDTLPLLIATPLHSHPLVSVTFSQCAAAEKGGRSSWRSPMLRYLLIVSALFLFTACSEMRVVGNAAMRELKAEGKSVEQIRLARN